MLEQVEEHKIVKNQFGFFKNKSSTDFVFSLTQSINQLVEQNETVIGVFLDLANGFKLISLIRNCFRKNCTYGFGMGSKIMQKIIFYLTENQCVKSGIVYLDWKTINYGVP